MHEEQVDIRTPEYVSLKFQPAGLGSRAAALMIDQIILTIVNILIVVLLFFVLADDNLKLNMFDFNSVLLGFFLITIFVINWGYFFALEYFWGGKTVGKRMLGIRVIQENGHSVTLLSCFIRNLMRIIDMLPVSYFLGMIMIFLHSKHKRLGDIVAGTIVVHERRVKGKRKEKAIEKEIRQRGLRQEDLSVEEWTLKQLGTKEWNLVRTYANRFLQLPLSERNQLSKKLADILFPKLGMDMEGKTYEELENTLLLLYLALREEWEIEW
ncbi:MULTISPECIES: RDD family protein [Rossellomorea]|uniref:RDD family protein n=1 Tax=Rossellomorea TaxID=2837508 RepID=UPI001CCACCA0|nr:MULTISPECIES: RDD family protein [Rossellomorea]MCA0150029.1 RDD family protein [Rossellomorea vietnamensis]UTE78194.1 RDD family protein [Rossellomorea sp. KS-H15a]WGG46153.1 RDD family protein [Rossellomorea sp. DA94]